MKLKSISSAAISTALLLGSLNANATPVEYFGEDLSPGASIPVSGDSEAARNAFLSQLTGVGIEDFEAIPAGSTAPLNLTFPGSSSSITATLNGTGGVCSTSSGTVGGIGCGNGRFPTSGDQYYHTSSAGFEIEFSTGISAFGFYGTDIGDFNGQLTATTAGGAVEVFNIAHTQNAPNGSLLFWGFIDKETSYTTLTFSNTGSSNDIFGFDDLIIGDIGQIVAVPEPAGLALLGAGLLGFGLSRKRKSA